VSQKEEKTGRGGPRMVLRMSGAKSEEATGGWRILCNEQLLYTLRDVKVRESEYEMDKACSMHRIIHAHSMLDRKCGVDGRIILKRILKKAGIVV
jgi:hypothetical protein